jgi:hypothetical protein
VGRVRAALVAAAGAAAGVCAARGWSEMPSASTLLGWLAAGLAALAVLNFVRSAVPAGALVGPVALATVAAVAFAASRLAEHRWHLHPTWWLMASAGGALVALGAILTIPAEHGRVLALGWVRRVKFDPTHHGEYSAIVALGACHIDLTRLVQSATSGEESALTLRCIVVGGHVTLLVPIGWRIALDPTSSTVAVSVDDGSRSTDAAGPAAITIALRAFACGLRVRRR